MLKRYINIVALLGNIMLFAGILTLSLVSGNESAYAACSPGIPCTDYDLYSNSDASISSTLNGPKSGAVPLYDESSCDGGFMNQIYSKAYMQANRQVIMSEQLIHKPDSVLEYTCFDQFINLAGKEAPTFSETTAWKDRTISLKTGDSSGSYKFKVIRKDLYDSEAIDSDPAVENLSQALQYLISDVLNEYLTNNFSHTFLGEATTLDHSASAGIAYNCSHMSTVWHVAQCLDFGEDDQFRTFEELINLDPRTIPQECSPGASTSSVAIEGSLCPTSTAAPLANTNFSYDLIRTSNNCATSAGNFAYSTFDEVELQDYLTMGTGSYIPGTGGDTDGTVTCSLPVPTGVPVITYTIGSNYEFKGYYTGYRDHYLHYEYMCLNPGCYYRPSKQYYAEDVLPPYDDGAVGACVPY